MLQFLKNRYGNSAIFVRPLVVLQQFLIILLGFLSLTFSSRLSENSSDWSILLGLLIGVSSLASYWLLRKGRKLGLYFSMVAIVLLWIFMTISIISYSTPIEKLIWPFSYIVVVAILTIRNWNNQYIV